MKDKFKTIKEKIKAVQAIGNEVCEGCVNNCDRVINPEGCEKILQAISFLDEYIEISTNKRV
jgi:hypothetical protein